MAHAEFGGDADASGGLRAEMSAERQLHDIAASLGAIKFWVTLWSVLTVIGFALWIVILLVLGAGAASSF